MYHNYTLVSKAESMRLKLLTLTVFSTNERAKHVYEKVGFRETGCIPNELYKKGKFIDHIIMVKELT
jgi:RimJ/RimL family protein N-acetyltransferase